MKWKPRGGKELGQLKGRQTAGARAQRVEGEGRGEAFRSRQGL